MFLHLPRQRIQEFRALVAAQRLPTLQRSTRRLYRRIYVRDTSLRYVRDLFACRGIARLKVFSFRWWPPRPTDEMSKLSFMPLQPLQRLFRILWGGSIFHGPEFFNHAHSRHPLQSTILLRTAPGIVP